MRQQWQKILSVLLSVLMVTALMPPVAAATLTTEAGKVVLQPEEGEILYGVGEGLVASKEDGTGDATVSFYPVGSDGSVQEPMQYTLGRGGLVYNSNYIFGTFNGTWAAIDASMGEIAWQAANGIEYVDSGDNYVIYQTGPETYRLYDLDAKKDYNLPSSLVHNLYGYGEGKIILADKNNTNNYYYYDLATGQDAFPERHFLSGTPFSEGYARIMDENYNLCILDSSGNIVSSKEIAGGGFGEMSEGLFCEWEGGYGYVDHTGAVVIPHEYEEAEEFHNGYARATVGGDVYGLIERSTGEFIELGMGILTQASPAGTVWVAGWDNPRAAYLLRIADAKAAPTQLSAVKFVPYSKQIVEWGEGYELMSAEGIPNGMAVNNGVLSGVPGQAGTYDISVSVKAGDQLQLRRYALTVVENEDAAVDNSISDGYEIETYIPDTVTGEQDQLFTIDDTVTSNAGNNYNRFLDVYLDGVKLKGGKVADPAQAGADWEYYAMEGSTKITIYSKTFQNKPEGTHTISATFQSIDKTPGKVDTVSQNFELKRPAQPDNPRPDNPQPVNPGTGVKVGDVVKFTGNTHYYTSYDATGWKCLPGEALVTRIFERGKHQYHLIATEGGGSTVYGWVDFSDIAGTQEGGTPPAVEGRIVNGARVMVKAGAKTYTGGSLAGFVYKITYTVISIKGDRVVIGLNGVTTAAMNVNDLILVS